MIVTATTRQGRRYQYYACPQARKQTCAQSPVSCTQLDEVVRREVYGNRETADPGQRLRRVTYDAKTLKGTAEMEDGSGCDFRVEDRQDTAEALAATGRIPRISRLVALAIKLEQVIAEGKIGSRIKVGHLGEITRARMTQILQLRNLSPRIQEQLLWLPNTKSGTDRVTEKGVRQLALVMDWEEQERQFQALLVTR